MDAAISAALASFVCESPLTGFGAGGFMYIHEPGGKDGVVLDFFVAGGGSDGFERTEDLIPISVYFDETSQTFNAGAASCGVPGNAAGLALAAERYGSMPLSELVKPGIALGRDGVVINEQQGYILEILEAILTMTPESAALYAPDGNPLRTGDTFHYPDMSDALERFGAEGSEPFTSGEIAVKVAEWVRDHGGNLGIDDLRAYEPIVREPLRMSFRGAEVMMNPPSSSGGLLISYALGLLERLGPTSDAERLVAAMEASNSVRQDDFHQRLHQEGFAAEVLDPQALDAAVAKIESGEWVGGGGGAGGPDPDSDSLGSTTHITAVDAEGRCASVTCSNGTCSGIQVPGTGVHLNNMLGEEDLNPGGFHRIPPGQRVSSMMSPGAVLRDGELVLGIGSAGSNRIAHDRGWNECSKRDRCRTAPLRVRRGPGRARRGCPGARSTRAARSAGGALEAPEPLLRRGAGSGARPVDRSTRWRWRSPSRRCRLADLTDSRPVIDQGWGELPLVLAEPFDFARSLACSA